MRPDSGARSGSAPLILALLGLLAASPAFAGRPLSTEDASALADGRCQIEAWVDRSSDRTARWLVPACNFGGGVEWQAGITSVSADSYAQAKKIVKDLAADSPWAVGWVAGATKGAGKANPYALAPFTFAAGEVSLHLNAGWTRDRLERRNLALWGAAVEVPWGKRLTAVAEAFGQGSGRPFLRGGFRLSLTDSLAFDLTAVIQPGRPREERFLSLGVFWEI